MILFYHADYASKAKHMDGVFPKLGLKVDEKMIKYCIPKRIRK